eukprot:2332855-Amphidinium_carterae.1
MENICTAVGLCSGQAVRLQKPNGSFAAINANLSTNVAMHTVTEAAMAAAPANSSHQVAGKQ